MHGQYKMPGGKLVRVDVDVVDGELRDVVVSGDFFLYPDDALEQITGALVGLPSDSTEPEIAGAVSAAIPVGTEWLGSSPEALAIAVRRALDPGEENG
jgi:lipoate-protein ligase A